MAARFFPSSLFSLGYRFATKLCGKRLESRDGAAEGMKRTVCATRITL